MVVIRRIVDRQRAYTGIFLRGEPAQIFPTTDYEHGRILAIFKQDRPHEGIHNDFSDYASPEVRKALKAAGIDLPAASPAETEVKTPAAAAVETPPSPSLALTIYRPR
jgi:hypothetical protein